jgi:type I restriction enzyme S subunit
MHVGRDEKIPMAMQTASEPIIVSPAYFVFEIVQTDVLMPEYLMMWFSRPEFDRNAWFYTDADVRGGMNKSALLDMTLPIPSIDRQREIVEEYATLSHRISLNEQMIQKLEATAQTLYRKMFVDGIDKENLPDGWRMGTLGEVANCLDYKRRPLSEDERKPIRGEYPYYGAMSVVDYINQYIFDGTYLLFSEDGVNVIDEFGHPALQYLWGKFWVNNHAHVLQGNDVVSTEYLYMALKDVNATHLVTGAAQPKINQENMNSITLVVPTKGSMIDFNKKVEHIFRLYKLKIEENSKLKELQSLLLAKMGNIKQ